MRLALWVASTLKVLSSTIMWPVPWRKQQSVLLAGVDRLIDLHPVDAVEHRLGAVGLDRTSRRVELARARPRILSYCAVGGRGVGGVAEPFGLLVLDVDLLRPQARTIERDESDLDHRVIGIVPDDRQDISQVHQPQPLPVGRWRRRPAG